MLVRFSNETQRGKSMSDIFSYGWRRGNLFADLNRVVIEGSHGLGKRLEKQDEGSWTDFLLMSVVVKGLFRKVLFGELPPYRLVRLSNESFGSRELAHWHEPEVLKVCFSRYCLFVINSSGSRMNIFLVMIINLYYNCVIY